jgi:hypothetical protein
MTGSATKPISDYRDLYGYVCVYEHTPDEPFETLYAVSKIFCEVAGMEAKKDAKTYVVALGTTPTVIYALPFGHPMISKKALSIMYQVTPDGQCIRMPQPQKH